ncbi:MAG: TonB-dependent receptor [Prevotellaceae bacterium]|nr:TonB-dependent receptor [Prevotellaceae bacterium]
MKKIVLILGIAMLATTAGAQNMKDSVALSEVVVTAQKPLVKQKDDRTVYDMKSDDESKTNSLKEMLKKVPFVSLDNEGNIKLKGSGNIRIYKDGRPNNSFTKNAKEVLQAIPASLIDRVEVITEPGARYDAEGVDGILNIVFKKDTSLNGLMGQITAQTDDKGEPLGNLYLAAKKGKLDISTSYTFLKLLKSHNEQDIEQTVDYKASNNNMQLRNLQKIGGNVHVIGLDASYDLNPKNLISASVNGYFYNVDIFGNASLSMNNGGNLLYSFKDVYDNSNQKYYNFDGKIDYQHLTNRRGETLTLSYLLSTSDTHQQIGENYFDWIDRPAVYDYDYHFRDNDGLFVEHTVQFDWERPITPNHKINLGAKYINRNNSSKGEVLKDEIVDASTDFKHLTQIAAAYAEYRYVSPKWSFNAGLRYEYAYLKAKFNDGSADDYSRNLNDIVPFAGITYRINDANTLKLNYSSRVERPGIDYLNPMREDNIMTISEGNPYLNSSRPNKIALTHTYLNAKLVTSASLSASFNSDGIGSISKDIDNKIYTTYGNIQKYQNYLASIYLRWLPTPKTNLTVNISGGWNKVSNDNLALSQERWNLNGSINLNQTLFWKLKLDVNMGRWEQGVGDVYSHIDPVYYHGINLQRSFLKEDRLTVRVGVSNPFVKNQKAKVYNTQGDFLSTLASTKTQRWVGGTISYRFGSLRSQVKKAAKTIDNDDLVGQSKGKQ